MQNRVAPLAWALRAAATISSVGISRSGLDAGVVAGRLRAVGAVLRAGAGLDRQQDRRLDHLRVEARRGARRGRRPSRSWNGRAMQRLGLVDRPVVAELHGRTGWPVGRPVPTTPRRRRSGWRRRARATSAPVRRRGSVASARLPPRARAGATGLAGRARRPMSRAAGRWRPTTRRFDALGPDRARSTAGRSPRSRRTTTSGCRRTRPCVAAAHAAIERWGTGADGVAPRSSAPGPCHDELEAAIADWKGTERGARVPDRLPGQPRRAQRARPGRDVTRVQRRAQPRLDHRRLPPRPLPACRVYRHDDVGPPARAARRSRPAGAVVVTDSVFSMDGDVAHVAALAEVCAARRRAARARRGPRACSGPTLPDVDGPRGAAGGHAVEDARAPSAAGSPGRARRRSTLLVNRARSYIFTTGLSPADDAAAGLAALGVLRSAEGDGSVASTCGARRPGPRRATRRRSCRSCSATRQRR